MSDALWTLDEVLAATGGALTGTPPAAFDGVSIDSRTISKGDIFVAIKGDRLDGHDYAAKALEAGAGLALVEHVDQPMRAAGAVVQVPDALQALRQLGAFARQRSPAKIIAITGSVGKTSSKEQLRLALSANGKTHASIASFNNHWGVPLTLARLPRDAAYGVFEIGMSAAGEITPLTKLVRPHIAIITAIAESHLGQFNSLDEIADAKAEIFTGLEPGGDAVILTDTPYFDKLSALAHAAGAGAVHGFGHDQDAPSHLDKLVMHETGCCITANILGDDVIFKLGMTGEHMAINALAVLSAVKLAGADLARAAVALADFSAPKGRGGQYEIDVPGGTFRLIDESYNANPASMRAALAVMGALPKGRHGRRIAVLGDMLELGETSADLHAGLAQPVVDQAIDKVFAAGSHMRHLWEALDQSRQGAYAEHADGLNKPLQSFIRAGDVVMVKGSNGSRMTPVVDALLTYFGHTPTKT